MTKKTKILMGVSSKNRTGGPTTHLPILVEYFVEEPDYIIKTFIYGSKTDNYENSIKKIINTLATIFVFVYYLAAFRPHIIHLNTAFDKNSILRDVPFSILSGIFGQRLLFKIHGSHYDLLHTNKNFYKILIWFFFRGAKRVGVLSNQEKEEFYNQFGINQKIIVVKNIVTEVKLEVPDISFKFVQSNIYCVFISRIVEGKGLSDLIRALPLLSSKYSNFHLIVVGDGDQLMNSKKIAAQLGVENCVTWLGYIVNKYIPYLLSKSDLFVFPTHFPEGMPMVLIEALRSGTPIITTKARFVLNYLKEDQNCLFIEKGNPSNIVTQIEKLLSNKSLQEKMRTENPKLVSLFSKKMVGEEFCAVFAKMLAS
jgi:glycosyltransferase involved in cell wall biosynthesis